LQDENPMPKITIDQREIDVPAGTTLLEAARMLGIDVPTLCYLEGVKPQTSCLVCLVKVANTGRLVPSCGTVAQDGMQIESETAEVHAARRSALELLLSDHLGDCFAPCEFACPAHMDVPLMLEQIAGEDFGRAIATVKESIALPAVLGRICPKPCEKGCRRNAANGPVAVCQLKRFVADEDLQSDAPYVPEIGPSSGKRVAVIGAGPTGLSAAYFLRRAGHEVSLLDRNESPGGRLLEEPSAETLPPEVLRAEIDAIMRVGIQWQPSTEIADAAALEQLLDSYDAVLVAAGAAAIDMAGPWSLEASPRGIAVDKGTYQTSRDRVFAAGNAVRKKGLVVRSVADGKEAAGVIDSVLATGKPVAVSRPFSTRIGRVDSDEIDDYLAVADPQPRHEPEAGAEFDPREAAGQAGRCLQCGCRDRVGCALRRYAEQYGADPNRYRGQRRRFEQIVQPSGVIYEPGKCIDCGLCVEIVQSSGEPLGLTFVGRGFDVSLGVPFGRSMEEALGKVAARCVAACPTGALAMRGQRSQLTILGQ
jgi:NADPH-dependent glutamate synthase beta subunit-like oxidoreductase